MTPMLRAAALSRREQRTLALLGAWADAAAVLGNTWAVNTARAKIRELIPGHAEVRTPTRKPTAHAAAVGRTPVRELRASFERDQRGEA